MEDGGSLILFFLCWGSSYFWPCQFFFRITMFKIQFRNNGKNLALFLLIMLNALISPLNAQESQHEISKHSEYEILMDELNQMEGYERFEEARVLLLQTIDRYPDKWFELAQELAYLNRKTERYLDNLHLFKEGHKKGGITPADILNYANLNHGDMFNQEDKSEIEDAEIVQDTMDIALCSVDRDNVIQIACAKNPAIIIKKTGELIEVK